jgi:hypothetical protein
VLKASEITASGLQGPGNLRINEQSAVGAEDCLTRRSALTPDVTLIEGNLVALKKEAKLLLKGKPTMKLCPILMQMWLICAGEPNNLPRLQRSARFSIDYLALQPRL